MGRIPGAAKNRSDLKAYDRLHIVIPKGAKKILRRAADREGVSLNAYVKAALLEKLRLPAWPDDPDSLPGS